MASFLEIEMDGSIGGAQYKRTYKESASPLLCAASKVAYMSTLAERIRSARIDARIAEPAELARRVSVRPAAVYQWESGATKSLKAETALALAETLNVNIRWLVTGKGMRAPAPVDAELLRQAVLKAEHEISTRGFTGVLAPEDHAEVILACYDGLREERGISQLEQFIGGMLRAMAKGTKVP